MATKKEDFKATNPALNFISESDTTKAEAKNEVPAVEAMVHNTPPKGYKLDPAFIETKSKKVQILIQPSTHEKMKELSKKNGVSFNESINRALKVYLSNNGYDV